MLVADPRPGAIRRGGLTPSQEGEPGDGRVFACVSVMRRSL